VKLSVSLNGNVTHVVGGVDEDADVDVDGMFVMLLDGSDMSNGVV